MIAEFKSQMQLFCFSKLGLISDMGLNIRNAFWVDDLACIESRKHLHPLCFQRMIPLEYTA